MNIFKTKSNRGSKNEDEDDPLEVRTVHYPEATLSQSEPFLVDSRVREEAAALQPVRRPPVGGQL